MTAKRIGRPTKSPKPGQRRASLGLRVRAAIKRKLDHAAARAGHSQSQEAEARIEQSFKLDETFRGGSRSQSIAILMASAFNSAGEAAAYGYGVENDWIENNNCYLAASFGAFQALLLNAPEGLSLERSLALIESLKGRIATDFLNKGSVP